MSTAKSKQINSTLLAPVNANETLGPRGRDLEGVDSPAGAPSKRRKTRSRSKIEINNDQNEIESEEEDGYESDHMSDIIPADLDGFHSAWQKTINHVVKAIVSIRFCQVAPFDTDDAIVSEATGFIVDAENGIILTNRHVACAGPFFGQAICHNHEEIDVHTVYRDPIHDFGFLKFDPKQIKYMPVQQVELRPDLAKIGLDIRVVGNDAGEKLSILAGSISRLDRNTPEYGDLTYNDFNTFYIQAAASSSGGSSGSPVIDIEGNAVALQAGGAERASTDFFLPLDRVKRALEYIQRDKEVPRGDIQTVFRYGPFDEARKLGLRAETEKKLRVSFPEEIGVLIVHSVVPEGPADNLLEEGDILITINGKYITKFVPFEEILDSNIGKEVVIGIERGGEPMEFKISVCNLHEITPDRYVEIGGAVLHELSYQLAAYYNVPCKGVFVASCAGMFRLDGDDGWIIKSIDDKETPNLDAFIQVMKNIPDYSRVPCVYYSIGDVHTILGSIIYIDKHWGSFRLAVRNDKTGLWDYTDLGNDLPPVPSAPKTKRITELHSSIGPAKSLIRCVVKVSFRTPCRIDGFPYSHKQGSGIILDKEQGLVVVSCGIIPNSLGDVTVTVADSIVIPAKVLFLHPMHNYCIIQYDPEALGDTNVMSAPISDKKLSQGDRATLVALSYNRRPVFVNTMVTEICCDMITPSSIPKYRATNLELFTLESSLSGQCPGGLLADEDGRVQGLWLNFLGDNGHGRDVEYFLGIHVSIILPILKRLRQGEQSISLRTLNIEFTVPHMSSLYAWGLSEEWIEKAEEASPNKPPQFFMVRSTMANTESAKLFKELDVLLAINGKVVTHMDDLDIQYEANELELTILREKKEMTIKVNTGLMSGDGTSRIVLWSGAVLQEPHYAVLQQSKTLPSQIYVTNISHGSPASMYGLQSTMWITHIQGKKVDNLDDFVREVKDIPDKSYVRVRCVDFDNIPVVISVKTLNHYFPLTIMNRDLKTTCGWSKQDIC